MKVCRDIGLGAGGFYQPGYRDGGKLHLKMMCLGQNWDPDSGQYGDFRLIDDAKPPSIPLDFLQFVENAIGDSHALIAKNSANVEDILPWMSPNICIVNFYSLTGRLGLHQVYSLFAALFLIHNSNFIRYDYSAFICTFRLGLVDEYVMGLLI